MKSSFLLLSTTFITACSLVGSAVGQSARQNGGGGLDIGLGAAGYVGTTGAGLQGVISLNNNISLVGGYDFATIDFDVEDNIGIPITDGASLDASTSIPYAMIGLHPFANDIRLAAGLAMPDIKAEGVFAYESLVPTGYKGDIAVSASNSANVAPVVTAGFVQSPRGGIGIYTELGAVFSGTLETVVSAKDTCAGGATCEDERQALQGKVEKGVEDALGAYPGFYPVVRFGIQVSF